MEEVEEMGLELLMAALVALVVTAVLLAAVMVVEEEVLELAVPIRVELVAATQEAEEAEGITSHVAMALIWLAVLAVADLT